MVSEYPMDTLYIRRWFGGCKLKQRRLVDEIGADLFELYYKL